MFCLFIFSQLLYGQSFTYNQESNELEALIGLLREKTIPFELRPLLADYGGFGSSLLVRIGIPAAEAETETAGASPGTFVLAVPLGSAFAVETALAFIELAGIQKPPQALLVAFLGNEKSKLDDSEYAQNSNNHKGLRDLISLSDMPGTWAVCYLDADITPETLLIRHGSTGSLFSNGSGGNAGSIGYMEYIAALELVKPLHSIFKSKSIPASFEVRHNELFKLGLARFNEELALLWEGEINGIYLCPGIAGKTSKKIEAANLADSLLEYAAGFSFPLENTDRHYTLLTLGRNTIFISEKASVIYLISGIGIFFLVFLIFTIFKRVMLISKFRVFLKYSWIFLFFLPLMILIIRGAGLLYSYLLGVFGIPVPGSDFWGSILVIIFALLLFYVLSLGLDFYRFYRKSSFYGISAILLALSGLIAAAVLDFTFMTVFLWVFIFTFLASTLKNPALILIAVLLIPLQALLLIKNIQEIQSLPVYFFILQNNFGTWVALFQGSILCLPFILLLKRYFVYFNRKKSHNNKKRVRDLWYGISILAILLGLMVFQVQSLSRERPEQQAQQDISTDSTFTISLTETVFLESRIVNVRLESPVNPLRFDLFLKSDDNEAPLIYSAPIPQELQSDNSVRFILGENPPNPLELEIVLRHDFKGSFRGEVIFDERPPSAGLPRDPILRIRGKEVPLTS